LLISFLTNAVLTNEFLINEKTPDRLIDTPFVNKSFIASNMRSHLLENDFLPLTFIYWSFMCEKYSQNQLNVDTFVTLWSKRHLICKLTRDLKDQCVTRVSKFHSFRLLFDQMH
jgi:hypothetical protein